MKRVKINYLSYLYVACAVFVSISCISCSFNAPSDRLIKQDWAFYCESALKDSFSCMDMRIVGKSIVGDKCEVFIAAKVVKTINGRPEKETLEIKYRFLYNKFDSGWTAIMVDKIV